MNALYANFALWFVQIMLLNSSTTLKSETAVIKEYFLPSSIIDPAGTSFPFR